MIKISPVRFATEYYDKNNFTHCERVVMAGNPSAPYYIKGKFPGLELSVEEIKEDLVCVAWLHDIYEDTSCPHFFEGDIEKALRLLTHDKIKNSYPDYLKKIKKEAELSYAGQLAYWVKIADMKDHLSQTLTLTDKLKAKYLEGLAILL